MSNDDNRKEQTSLALTKGLKRELDAYAAEIFGPVEVPRSRSAAARILLKLALTDERRFRVQR